MLERCSKRISEIPHLWAGSAVMLSVPRRQMTSATAQGRKGGRRQARGQRVQVLLKPLLWSLDILLHLQERALTVTVFLFLERIFVATSDSRVVLQIKTTPWWLYLLCSNGAAKGGCWWWGPKPPFLSCLLAYFWILNQAVWAIHRKLFFIFCAKGHVEGDSHIFEAKLYQQGTTLHLTSTAPQQSSRSWILPGI